MYHIFTTTTRFQCWGSTIGLVISSGGRIPHINNGYSLIMLIDFICWALLPFFIVSFLDRWIIQILVLNLLLMHTSLSRFVICPWTSVYNCNLHRQLITEWVKVFMGNLLARRIYWNVCNWSRSWGQSGWSRSRSHNFLATGVGVGVRVINFLSTGVGIGVKMLVWSQSRFGAGTDRSRPWGLMEEN